MMGIGAGVGRTEIEGYEYHGEPRPLMLYWNHRLEDGSR